MEDHREQRWTLTITRQGTPHTQPGRAYKWRLAPLYTVYLLPRGKQAGLVAVNQVGRVMWCDCRDWRRYETCGHAAIVRRRIQHDKGTGEWWGA